METDGARCKSLIPEMKSLSRFFLKSLSRISLISLSTISLKSLSSISFCGKYQVSSSPGRHLAPLLTHFVGKSLIRRPAPARFNFWFFKSLSLSRLKVQHSHHALLLIQILLSFMINWKYFSFWFLTHCTFTLLFMCVLRLLPGPASTSFAFLWPFKQALVWLFSSVCHSRKLLLCPYILDSNYIVWYLHSLLECMCFFMCLLRLLALKYEYLHWLHLTCMEKRHRGYGLCAPV